MYSLHSAEGLEQMVLKMGFLPFFKNQIDGFSIEECTPSELWFEKGVDGPWEWKGPVIRNWNCMYGKFFGGKAGYVSREWLPDFINYRRANYGLDAAPLDEEGHNREKMIYDTVVEHESLLSNEIKTLCGLQKKKKARNPIEAMLEEIPTQHKGESFETALTRLQMATLLVTADFEYKFDKHDRPYGWGVARYATPEALFGEEEIMACNRTPEESKKQIINHFHKILPQATDEQILKMIG